MRERECGANGAIVLGFRTRTVQQEPRQFSGCGARQAKVPNLPKSRLINMAEDLRHSQSGVAVLLEEMQEFFAGYEIGLDRFERLCRYFVR